MITELWLDTNACLETYHEFRRVRPGSPLGVYHVDGKECEATEFSFHPHARAHETSQFKVEEDEQC